LVGKVLLHYSPVITIFSDQFVFQQWIKEKENSSPQRPLLPLTGAVRTSSQEEGRRGHGHIRDFPYSHPRQLLPLAGAIRTSSQEEEGRRVHGHRTTGAIRYSPSSSSSS
jgi:hypothetical protein